MAFTRFLRFDLLAPLAISVLLGTTGPISAQDSVEPLLERLRAVQDNPNASAVELKSATIIVDRIVRDFPASEAAVSILYEETYEGIDFKSFESRLQANLNAPQQPAAQTSATQASAALAPLVQAPVAPVQAIAQSAINISCITGSFAPQARTPLQVGFSTDPNGAVTALPALLTPQSPQSALRKDYLGLALAIENCAPYAASANLAEHVLDVAANGAINLVPQPGATAAFPATGLVAFPTPATASPQTIPGFPFTSAQTETELNFDRPAVRDLQARLTVLGFDPNGVDGSLGKGARSAISAWQASLGVEATGFLNPPQFDHLKQLSEEGLAAWLLEPANAAKYNATQRKTTRRKKKRVRACKKNALGILYDCKIVYR